MTTQQMQKAGEGRDLWQKYVDLNGYAFRPNEKGLRNLSRTLGLDVPQIRECITLYLEA